MSHDFDYIAAMALQTKAEKSSMQQTGQEQKNQKDKKSLYS